MDTMATNDGETRTVSATVTYTCTLLRPHGDNKMTVEIKASDPHAYADDDRFAIYKSEYWARQDSGRKSLEYDEKNHRASGPRVDDYGDRRVWRANKRQKPEFLGAYFRRERDGTLTLVACSDPVG